MLRLTPPPAGPGRPDEAARMELLFSLFYEPLGPATYRIVPDRAGGPGLLQDVLLRAWQHRHELPAEPGSCRAALNAALRYAARGRHQVARDEAPPRATNPAAPDALAALHHQETPAAALAALAQLPAQCRTVFELSRYQQLSYQQLYPVRQ